ncbi:hypothetical protein ACIRBZ_34410 [Streptomyces sp. NPDC094038]
MSPKIAVICHSSTGTVHELAEAVADGARNAAAYQGKRVATVTARFNAA